MPVMNDAPVYVGRPVKLDLTDPIDRLIAANTNVYSGSVQMPCAACGGATWVGPEGQTAVTEGAEVSCFRCNAEAIRKGHLPRNIINLGDPEGELGGPERG
jgi:hypothetical protein